nr:MAG TPA: hypothetical protein [Caudoviricetes sp.]
MYSSKLHPMQSYPQMDLDDLIRFKTKFNLVRDHKQLLSMIDMAQFKVRLALITYGKMIKWLNVFMYLAVDPNNKICISVESDWLVDIDHPELIGHRIHALNEQLEDIYTQYTSSNICGIKCTHTQCMKLHIVGGNTCVHNCMFVQDTPKQVLSELHDWLDDSISRGSFVGMN